ncbi:expressed protein [Phakopsora pachyrhizi]|uniref:Expressed protein n=1 Tax=Phakopsora pachyrhizi TaxID=170000 RepID=A0AAV0BQJ8_PHAPC|nr:expressed protein [Phakopsora pachyrhizi]
MMIKISFGFILMATAFVVAIALPLNPKSLQNSMFAAYGSSIFQKTGSRISTAPAGLHSVKEISMPVKRPTTVLFRNMEVVPGPRPQSAALNTITGPLGNSFNEKRNKNIKAEEIKPVPFNELTFDKKVNFFENGDKTKYLSLSKAKSYTESTGKLKKELLEKFETNRQVAPVGKLSKARLEKFEKVDQEPTKQWSKTTKNERIEILEKPEQEPIRKWGKLPNERLKVFETKVPELNELTTNLVTTQKDNVPRIINSLNKGNSK